MHARTLKLTLAYDGAGFHGWQRQPGIRTVQETVEDVARRILRHPLVVLGASRTDAGVHAAGQCAHIQTDSEIPSPKLLRAIGHRLPPDVSLVDLVDVPPGFHAIRSAQGKLYRYRIHNAERRPVEDQRQRVAWHAWTPLDVDAMRAAGAVLTGRHDFAAFAAAGCERENTVRTVHRVCVARRLDEVVVEVQGDGFLYHQVRNMVGTLVEVGRGHWSVERVAAALASRDRRQAGPTAPAHGLSLRWVRYPPLRSLAS